jgi:putative efflux protein, MATE family
MAEGIFIEGMDKTKYDLTEGNLPLQLFLFTLPLMSSYYIQQLYNSADLLVAGNFLGKKASAAIGASSLMVNCAIGLFIGLSVGVGIIYAKATGAGEKGVKQDIFEASILISVVGGGILTAVGYSTTPALLRILHTPAEILPTAGAYLKIYFLCLIPMILYNMISGLIRASGNSRAPMTAQIIAGILHILLDVLFVVGLGIGIRSLAFATFISQSTGAVIVLVMYLKGESEVDPHTLFRNVNFGLLKQILILGLPVGFQNVIMTLSNIFIQYNINQLGINAIAAFTNYSKIESLIYYPMFSYGQANLYFVSQNIGAHRTDRVKLSIKASIVMGLLTVIPIEFSILHYGEFFFHLFNPDQGVIAEGLRIIRVTFPFYWLYVFVEVLSYTIRGYGKTTQAMIITFFNFCVVRFILLIVFSRLHGGTIEYIASIYPITWVLSILCLGGYWFHLRKSLKARNLF